MPSWKDRVTDKLTNLFSDSSSSSLSPGSPRSHKARSYSKDGNYFSSVLTFMRPSSESSSNKHESHLKPIQSLPTRWKNRDISWQRIPLDTYDEGDDKAYRHEQNGPQSSLKDIQCENREVSNARDETRDQGSAGSTSSSEVFEDATEPNTPMSAVINLALDSVFISPELYQFFQSSLPNIVKGCQWVLLYRAVR